MNATEILQGISETLYDKLTDPSTHLLYRRALERWIYPKHIPLHNISPETLDALLEALYMPLEPCQTGAIDFEAVKMKRPPAIETSDNEFAYTLSQVPKYSVINAYFFRHFPHLTANEEKPCT